MADREIWKFETRPFAEWLRMPRASRVLSVGVQDGGLVVWASVVPTAATEEHRVVVARTGGMVPPGMRFVGTAQLPDGTVWHVYAEGTDDA